MAIEVTERYTARRYKSGESASRGFDVTDVGSTVEAVQAVIDYGVDVDDAYPEDARLRAEVPDCVGGKGPRHFVVTYNYIKPEQGSISKPEDDPLDEPIDWMWDDGELSMPTDIDAEGNPLVNAAYYPLEGITEEIGFYTLVGQRNESSFDVTRAIAYKNKVNSDSVTIPMVGTVAPGQLLCRSVKPVAKYNIKSEYLPMAYTFWLWGGRVQDADGLWDSWKHRILNAGRTGWWSDSGTPTAGNFIARAGVPVSAPVLLRIDGRPLDATITVEREAQADGEAPAIPPTAVNANLFEVTANASFLKYYKFKSLAFSGLTLF